MQRAAIAMMLVVMGAAPAAADGKADALFEKGKKALAQKQYADACEAFELSDQLDPGIGVKLNAARCYEEWGKLARAYTWYVDAAALAEKQKDKRLPQIKELVDALDADVPTLTIQVPPNSDIAGSQLKLDGKPLPDGMVGKETRVDPGPHELTWLSGGARKSKTLALERGASREVQLDLAPAPPAATASVGVTSTGEPVAEAPGGRSRTRTIASAALVGAGVVALGVSGYLTLSAKSDYNDALDTECMGMTTACSPRGLELTSDARSRANTATVFALVGVAAAAGGVILYLTAPSSTEARTGTAYVTPSVSPTSAGLVVGGAF